MLDNKVDSLMQKADINTSSKYLREHLPCRSKTPLSIYRLLNAISAYDSVEMMMANSNIKLGGIIKNIYREQDILDVTDTTFLKHFRIKRDYIMNDYINRFVSYYLSNRYPISKLDLYTCIDKMIINNIIKIIKQYYSPLYKALLQHRDWIINNCTVKNRCDMLDKPDLVVDSNMLIYTNPEVIRVTRYQFKFLEIVTIYLENKGDIEKVSKIYGHDKQTLFAYLNNTNNYKLLKDEVVKKLTEYLSYEEDYLFGANLIAYVNKLIKLAHKYDYDIIVLSNQLNIPVEIIVRLLNRFPAVYLDDMSSNAIKNMIEKYNNSIEPEINKPNMFVLKPYKPKSL